MSDTALQAETIISDARASLAVLDEQIAAMRQQKKGLSEGIAQALERRKLYVRIVAAANPRTRKANGEVQLNLLDDE